MLACAAGALMVTIGALMTTTGSLEHVDRGMPAALVILAGLATGLGWWPGPVACSPSPRCRFGCRSLPSCCFTDSA